MAMKRSGALTEDDTAEIMNRDSDNILCQRAVHQNNHEKILEKTF
jgi:hypothetical protein